VKPPTKHLSSLSEHRLRGYTVAATAAGVGALCLTQPAEAKIVYTPANVKIVQNGGLIGFDLNHDGVADFGLSNRIDASSGGLFLKVVPKIQANEVWKASGTFFSSATCAAALSKGTKVGSNGRFGLDFPSGKFMAISNHNYYRACPWANVKQAYLGLKFAIKGKTHFGWARVKVSIGRSITATLTGYAYETIPGKPIIAGATKGPDEQAGSLGTLAAGAVGR